MRLAAALVPNSEVLSQLGRQALFCNHPHAAVEALTRLDPGQGWIPSWTPHWRRLTEAYHMVGDHELDLAHEAVTVNHVPAETGGGVKSKP